jgi:hypothetical protein
MTGEPKCPTCGYVMCQMFDYTRVNDVATLAEPNGWYVCYHCSRATDDNYVAWLCYRHHDNGATTIHICDSDATGAFKVYRHPKDVPRA